MSKPMDYETWLNSWLDNGYLTDKQRRERFDAALRFILAAVPLLQDYAFDCRHALDETGEHKVGAPDTAARIDALIGSFPPHFPKEPTP